MSDENIYGNIEGFALEEWKFGLKAINEVSYYVGISYGSRSGKLGISLLLEYTSGSEARIDVSSSVGISGVEGFGK